ncbi:Plasma membrane fusion protein PRM1 like [Verticillium longisporum]|nr:Plasma membrane fusion protein PRM1 like [Verticillium longisporum]
MGTINFSLRGSHRAATISPLGPHRRLGSRSPIPRTDGFGWLRGIAKALNESAVIGFSCRALQSETTMLFTRKHKEEEAGYPAVPDSLRSDSVELLSQIWINRWTVLLLLVLVRVLLMVAGVDEDVDEANRKALSACTKVEDVGSAMASMPHYLSVGVNELSAQGIEKTLDGLVAVLGLLLTGIQGLILFVINMVTSMYVCLIAAFVHGGLDVASDVTEKVTDLMNSAISKITDTLESRAKNIEDGINNVKSSIEDSIIGSIVPFSPSPRSRR